jgi:uncharacterized pyridoxal phosphate-dependent enzyme
MNNRARSPYEELGVETIIQCSGTKTWYGGSRLAPEVFSAMLTASEHFVNIIELNRAVGRYIAEITGAEAGMVTSGAASGMVLSLAACMTGTSIAKVYQLPDTTGMKNKVVLQKIHCGHYSRLYGLTGARLVEVGNVIETFPEELENAVDAQTAAVAYLFGSGIPQTGLSLVETVTIAHKHNVPVIVDAAAMLPPRSNLRRFIKEGADLVTFSGGKFIRGPQATGILFGRTDLIEAAMMNANPNHGIGRPQKVSKEEMVGLYVALRRYMELDEMAELQRLEKLLGPILQGVRDLRGIDARIHKDDEFPVPVLLIRLSGSDPRVSAQIAKRLLDGSPRIFLTATRGRPELVINPIGLADEDPPRVLHRLREELCAQSQTGEGTV